MLFKNVRACKIYLRFFHSRNYHRSFIKTRAKKAKKQHDTSTSVRVGRDVCAITTT